MMLARWPKISRLPSIMLHRLKLTHNIISVPMAKTVGAATTEMQNHIKHQNGIPECIFKVLLKRNFQFSVFAIIV